MRSFDRISPILNKPAALQERIRQALHARASRQPAVTEGLIDPSGASAVLFLLGCQCGQDGRSSDEPCLILNKRSLKVRQPGDLCCPGGGIAPRLDFLLARLLSLPGTPLTRWEHWPSWRRGQTGSPKNLALLFATGLREGFEEMRLNPFGVRLLGALPPEQLVMFRRVIYPLVCWVSHQRKFKANWEVEKVVYVPLSDLMNPANYARFHLQIEIADNGNENRRVQDFPCFLPRSPGQTDRLWGATFRLTMQFLSLVFGFHPPDIATLPTIEGRLGENYLTGNG